MYDLDRDEYAMPRRARGCACGNDLPGMCPGPSNCPYNQPEPSDEDLADEAGAVAFSAAEDLAAMLDRYSGDWGNRPDALLDLAERIMALHAEAGALLGIPRKRTRSGGLTPGLTSTDAIALLDTMATPAYWRDRDAVVRRQVAELWKTATRSAA